MTGVGWTRGGLVGTNWLELVLPRDQLAGSPERAQGDHSFLPYLLLVLASGGIQGLDEGGGVADEHGVAGGAHDHAEHGEPDVGHAHGRLPSVPDAQHVAHGLEQGVGILLSPGVVLWTGAQVDRDTW